MSPHYHHSAELMSSSELLGNTIIALSYSFLKYTLCLKREINEKEGKKGKAVNVFQHLIHNYDGLSR